MSPATSVYLWVLTFILVISRQYLYRYVLAAVVAKWTPRLSDHFHSIPDARALQKGQSENRPV